MNKLSWLLYWADVLPMICTTLRVIATLLMIATVFGSFICCVTREKFTITRIASQLLFVGCITHLVASFVPSKETFYLIAGSEVSVKALETPEFQKVRKVINNFLDESLTEEAPAN